MNNQNQEDEEPFRSPMNINSGDFICPNSWSDETIEKLREVIRHIAESEAASKRISRHPGADMLGKSQ